MRGVRKKEKTGKKENRGGKGIRGRKGVGGRGNKKGEGKRKGKIRVGRKVLPHTIYHYSTECKNQYKSRL